MYLQCSNVHDNYIMFATIYTMWYNLNICEQELSCPKALNNVSKLPIYLDFVRFTLSDQ